MFLENKSTKFLPIFNSSGYFLYRYQYKILRFILHKKLTVKY